MSAYPHPADLGRARRDVVEVCRLMHQRGYLVARDGNVSVRVGPRRLLVTPTGARKATLEPDSLVLTELDGTPVRGERGRPSSELAMHVAVYAARADVGAVVHAHPPASIAHTVAGVSLSAPLMPEVFVELGEIYTVPYTTPTTDAVAAAVGRAIVGRRAVIMERHGSVTVGTTLAEAYDRLEILEHAARISLMARALAGGPVSGLDAGQLDALRALG